MATFDLPAQVISTTEFVSPSQPVPAGLQGATITMISCPEWSTASGWFSWAIEASYDGGLTWLAIASQGYVDPHQLAIGARTRQGGLPWLGFNWNRTGAALVRSRLKTDGATLTCSFQLVTTP